MPGYKPLISSSFILFSSLCIGATFVSAQEPSMEAPVDPMPTPTPAVRLYLSTAGSAPQVEFPLTSYERTHICPSKYKSGFTLRCDVSLLTRGAGVVLWRVRGVSFREEYFAPYFLAGNWKDRVGSFDGMDEVAKGGKFRVACQVKGKRNVWVELVKSC